MQKHRESLGQFDVFIGDIRERSLLIDIPVKFSTKPHKWCGKQTMSIVYE